MNTTYNIKLLAPSAWQPLVDNAFSELPVKVAARAKSILRTLHNRHVGITPKLAAGLAVLLDETHSSYGRTTTWDIVVKRLLRESSGERQSFGVLLSAVPMYSIIRLVMPVVEEACHRVRLCFLFCGDSMETNTAAEEYDRYSLNLETEIQRMATNTDDYFQLFWADRAFTLSTYSRRAGDWEYMGSQLPETDPSALGLLLRIRPYLQKSRSLPQLHRSLNVPLQHREISRLKEGGFSGIHITRRIDDMGDILLSEFINPPAVLADRIINNGFLAVRRQTKREQLRDVLVVGIMPGHVTPKLSRDFIKTCWLDFISRFGMMLIQSKQVRSEFRWLEGDALDRVSSSHFLLQDLPSLEIPPDGHSDPVFRKDFLLAMGWLPHFLDTQRRFHPVSGRGTAHRRPVRPKPGSAAARDWAFRVWNTQKENLLWTVHESSSSIFSRRGDRVLDIDRFVYVHIMLFLPAAHREYEIAEVSAAAQLGSLFNGFGLRTLPGRKRSVSITWVPDHVRASNQWAFDCRGKHDSMLFPVQKTNINPGQIAGRLEETWRDQLIKELRET